MLFKRKKTEQKLDQTWTAKEQIQLPGEPTYIAKDARLHGDILTDSEIHIDGTLEGSIQAHTCLIDQNGEVRGSISAQYVVVRGRVLGPISATQVTIQKGAHVEGDVIHEGLSIEHGAFVMGSITQSTLPISVPGKFANGLFQPAAMPEDGDYTDESSNILPLKNLR
jgi:cytoskeletal protein CcmA (bactofilin family)